MIWAGGRAFKRGKRRGLFPRVGGETIHSTEWFEKTAAPRAPARARRLECGSGHPGAQAADCGNAECSRVSAKARCGHADAAEGSFVAVGTRSGDRAVSGGP